MITIITDKQINQNNKNLVGNKAFNLAFISQNGIKTSSFFVIPTYVFDELINYDPDVLLKEIEKEILENADNLHSNHFAVRSSATCEDGNSSSFAGQFESYLSVTQKRLLKAIKKCWQSAFSNQVKIYCQYHKFNHQNVKMSVIIQKMVNAQKGGVIFTHNIFNGSKDIVIEGASGLGENIVSGLVDPERIIISRKKITYEEESTILTKIEIENLYKIALKIEKLYKAPQDIEWAIENNEIYILQTRPITS